MVLYFGHCVVCSSLIYGNFKLLLRNLIFQNMFEDIKILRVQMTTDGIGIFILVQSWLTLFLLYRGGNWRTKENHRPVASHWQTLSHNIVHLALMIDTDSIGSCKSSYHTITDTTVKNQVCQWLATGRWFSLVLQFPPRYNKNSVESGAKHHQINKNINKRWCM
jgi:hypothetical protein